MSGKVVTWQWKIDKVDVETDLKVIPFRIMPCGQNKIINSRCLALVRSAKQNIAFMTENLNIPRLC